MHDIPVTVVPRRLWSDYLEPETIDPDVGHKYCHINIRVCKSFPPFLFQIAVHLPHLRLLKNIVERMKNLANMVTLHVTSEGLLTLTVETDTVSVTSHFDDLHVEKNSNSAEKYFKIQH